MPEPKRPASNRIREYPIKVFWSDEDEGFIAIAPDLPGASAWGKTEAEAIKELHTAVGLWIKTAKKVGKPIIRGRRLAIEHVLGRRRLRRTGGNSLPDVA